MAVREKKIIRHMGWVALVKRMNEKKFSRVGFLFNSRREAEEWVKENFSSLPNRIQGVRLDCTPLKVRKNAEGENASA